MPVEFNHIFFSFLKILFILAGIIYTVFAVVAIRQIHTMQKSLMTSLSGKLKILGYVHLVFAILVLLFFIVSL